MIPLIDAIRYLKRRVFYVEGFFVLLTLSASLYVALAASIGPHLMRAMNWSGYILSKELASVLFLFGFVIVIISISAFWYNLRRTPRITHGELGVLFAPYFSEAVADEVDKLFILIKQELKSHEFANRFTVLKLPPNIPVNSHEEAVSVLAKCNATVLVWGVFDNGATTVGFSPIRFTFHHSPIIPSQEWLDRIAVPIACGRYRFESKDVPVEREVLAKNIDLIARNLMGLAVLVAGLYADAEKIFSRLWIDVKTLLAKGKGNLAILERFFEQIKSDYTFAITGQICSLYSPYLFNEKLFKIPFSDLHQWLLRADKGLQINPRDSGSYMLKATFHFLLGQEEKAIQCAKRAKLFDQRALAGINFSLAFLYNYTGQFKKSRKEYKLGMAKESSYEERLVKECSYFIRQAIERYPEKKQLRLAFGLIEFYRGCREIGISEITQFIEIAEVDVSLNEFVVEGKRILKEAGTQSNIEDAILKETT